MEKKTEIVKNENQKNDTQHNKKISKDKKHTQNNNRKEKTGKLQKNKVETKIT